MNYNSLGVLKKIWRFHVDNKNPLYFARTYVYMRRNCIPKMRAIACLVFLKITVEYKPVHDLSTVQDGGKQLFYFIC